MELEIDLSGASRAILSGVVDRIDAHVSGASQIAARELEARTARVALSGASTGTLTVTETIERIEASGASTLTYFGDAVVEDISSSGASRIRKG
ncbi:MAG TPA: DUF2807 domain-containing protein [Dehalococcoidia bacterium]|nr:DUF2807 domain-containing protein [Dehalococcoidia bacterium]